MRYLKGPFISFHWSWRKHRSRCFLISKGFTFLFHWDGNFQVILIVFFHMGKDSPFVFVLPWIKLVLVFVLIRLLILIPSEKENVPMEIIFWYYEGVFNSKSPATRPWWTSDTAMPFLFFSFCFVLYFIVVLVSVTLFATRKIPYPLSHELFMHFTD